jgi:transcriptional repressor NrdR
VVEPQQLIDLGPLRALDEVAYLRFASVYQAFSSVDDFEKAIVDLRAEHGGRPPAEPDPVT